MRSGWQYEERVDIGKKVAAQITVELPRKGRRKTSRFQPMTRYRRGLGRDGEL